MSQESEFHEAPIQPKIIYNSNDYDGRKVAEKTHWYGSYLIDNEDGTLTLQSSRNPIEIAPDPSSPQTRADHIGRSNEGLNYDACEILFNLAQGELGPVMNMLGYFSSAYIDEQNGIRTFAVTYPKPAEQNILLDEERDKTGFSLGVDTIQGEFFNRHQSRDAWNNGRILVSDDPKTSAHDSVFHNPFYFLLPNSTVRLIAQRIDQAVTKFDELNEHDSPLTYQSADQACEEVIGDIETGLSAYNLKYLDEINGPNTERGKLIIRSTLLNLIFGYNPPQGADKVADQEYEALLKRIEELKAIADSPSN